MNKLLVIEAFYVPRTLFDLFKTTVYELINREKPSEILALVSEVTKAIKMEGVVVMNDPSTHSRRDRQIEILQGALRQLALYPSSRTTVEEIATAIRQDSTSFQRDVALVSAPQVTNSITVYDMMDPDAGPLTLRIPCLSKCRQVKRYLQCKRIAASPDLWARHHGKQQLTPNGLWWEWLPLSESTEGKHLEFVDRAKSVCTGDYIVVLKYVGQKEVPEPIAIAPLGSPCCGEKCGNLRAHLERIWPNHMVTQAFKIEDGTDVLTETFDDSLFDPRTNDLCVHVE
ncbi:hypothetical protein M408DRAFT_328324 [Serendipita vermifera MAFF 305830]|uniref:Uncharacterized protein n=1 Tax=Serendipita vermifera MAFF 305830 TaxID=933852 RepID=A0A0C3BDS9_SERVB|nr:hypothetical protein M408DRAFT_328324 [Serendipita vermifera MAFF 305830]